MMSHMQNITGQWLLSLKHYVLMSLLLSSPERLPYNPYCVVITVFAYFLLGLLLIDTRGYGIIFAQIVLELGMLALIAFWGLRWKEKLARFTQTFSAMTGANMIITCASIPLQNQISGSQEEVGFLGFYLFVAILFWNLAVLSLILKRALEISTHLSAMISFNYFVVYYFTVIWFLK